MQITDDEKEELERIARKDYVLSRNPYINEGLIDECIKRFSDKLNVSDVGTTILSTWFRFYLAGFIDAKNKYK